MTPKARNLPCFDKGHAQRGMESAGCKSQGGVEIGVGQNGTQHVFQPQEYRVQDIQ